MLKSMPVPTFRKASGFLHRLGVHRRLEPTSSPEQTHRLRLNHWREKFP